ncbi:hypothetical protein [Terriglobus sp. TAA 43]|uniref:hypothetical protein n=1 Tax=Terriglobus sp. TAA 43 TaxID=278961 RepID=UPI0012EE4B8F|nr:hypothetical protein [Terriglobus sp. TAA 43]
MSYYLAVFDPENIPLERDAFLEWFRGQTDWNEPIDYDNPANATVRLRSFIADIFPIFPPLNGPLAEEELPGDEATAADYCIAPNMVYIAFAWSKSAQANETVFRLAAKNKLGFYDVSSPSGEVWLPKNGTLVLSSKHKLSLLTRARKLIHAYRSLP